MQKMLNNVLREVRPTSDEKKHMENFTKKILKISKPIAKLYSAEPMLCGSVVKDTWLSGRKELDLFLLFNQMLSRKKLQEHGLTIAKEIISKLKGKHQIAYAEHPYLKGFVKDGKINYDIDIVPAYKIPDPKKIKSAVDRTPHHVLFVKKMLKLPDEARLLKQFLKSNECYGADLKTQGFSGYLSELLTLNYGKFYGVVKAASKWRAPVVISLSKKIDKEGAFKKFKHPLIVMDPVDPNRNVAAAVSTETFYKFVKTCKDFLENPSKKFFFAEKPSPYSVSEISKELRRRGTRWYMIKFKRPNVLDDVLYPQMRRCLDSIEKILTDGGFRVLRKGFWCNTSCILVLEMDIWLVPRTSKNIGPNIYSRHAEQFLKHYKDSRVFVEGNNWVVEKDRKFITVRHTLENLFKGPVKELKGRGIPNKLAPELHRSRIWGGGEALKLIANLPKEFRIFMREWFEKDLNISI